MGQHTKTGQIPVSMALLYVRRRTRFLHDLKYNELTNPAPSTAQDGDPEA